jgi:periplasmic divalent cation tolerance protein
VTSDARFVYITCRGKDQARSIGEALVRERLAACANIIDKMESIYWWNNSVEESAEAVLIVKTRAGHMDALVTRVKELHSYEVPCVVSLPILEGNADYLAWIAAETERR